MTRYPDDPVSIARRAGLPDNLAAFMPRYINIESGGNPNAVTGSYSGLLQMGPGEIRQYGGSGVEHGARMYADRARTFANQNGRAPTPTELYLLNQQGPAGLAAHMKNPGGAAWENMYSTAEGQHKGPDWAKKAIIWNIPNDQREQFGMVKGNGPAATAQNMAVVDKVSSNNFLDVWHNKVERVPIPPRPPVTVANAPGGANDIAFDPITGAQLPGTGSGAPVAAAPSTGAVAAAALTGTPSANYPVAQYPGYRLPVQQSVEGGGSVPMPWRRPAGAGPNAAGETAPSPGGQAPSPGQVLGQRLMQAFAPPGASSYVDPNTGHTIVNPSGSGEMAMGLTRDVGAAPPAARQAPAPVPRPAVSSPPASSAGNVVSPSEPVPPAPPAPPAPPTLQRSTVPDVLAPLMQTPESAPSPPMSQNNHPDILAQLGGGGTGGMRLPLAPRWLSDAPTTDARLQQPVVDPTMFSVKQAAQQNVPLSGPVPVAPEAAGLLAPPGDQATASSRPPFMAPPNATTQLNPLDEMAFKSFVLNNKVPFDTKATGPTDYDMRGFWKRMQQGDPMATSAVNPTDNRLHYPDIWKTPLHETFSSESMFAKPDTPSWINDRQMATPNARLTFGQNSPLDRMLASPDVSPPPGANAALPDLPSGGQSVPSIPMTQPVTVEQQLGGLSPFQQRQPQPMEMLPNQQQQDELLSRFAVSPQQSGFASTTLLPFQQWPPVGFDTAGWGSPAMFNFGDFG